MAAKPLVAASYPPSVDALARATTLYIATKLGDLRDDLVVVGGLVPSLIIPQTDATRPVPHIGTMDVDLGLAVAMPKDAYDLVYVLQNYGTGIADVFRRIEPLLKSPIARRALAFLEREFAGIDSVGPMRVAEFLGDREDETIRADAAGAVRALLRLCQAKQDWRV